MTRAFFSVKKPLTQITVPKVVQCIASKDCRFTVELKDFERSLQQKEARTFSDGVVVVLGDVLAQRVLAVVLAVAAFHRTEVRDLLVAQLLFVLLHVHVHAALRRKPSLATCKRRSNYRILCNLKCCCLYQLGIFRKRELRSVSFFRRKMFVFCFFFFCFIYFFLFVFCRFIGCLLRAGECHSSVRSHR